MEIDKDYVTNQKFCFPFLRAERFDVAAAANRLLRFVELKLEIFGQDLLCKDIQQDDLDPTSLEVLYLCWHLDLPVRDNAGRQVAMFVHQKGGDDIDSYPILNRMKALFYAMCVGGREEETQKNGRVYVVWIAGDLGDASTIWRLTRLKQAAPFSHKGIHICVDSNHNYSLPMVAIVQMAMSALVRVRIRRHIGTVAELKYELMTYGIPVDYLPIGKDGRITRELHVERWKRIRNQERWLQQQTKGEIDTGKAAATNQTSDDTATTTTTTEAEGPASLLNHPINTPSNSDILMGKGRGNQSHIGNVRFRTLIEACLPQYNKATTKQKTLFANEIIRIVRDDWKGKFLVASDRNWIPIADDKKIRSKVSVCFRDARKHQQKCKKKEGHTLGTPEAEKTEKAETKEDPVEENENVGKTDTTLLTTNSADPAGSQYADGGKDIDLEADDWEASILDDLNDDPLIHMLLMTESEPAV